MNKVKVECKDELGMFRFTIPVNIIRKILSTELIEELKKFEDNGPVTGAGVVNKEYLQALIEIGLVCGFYINHQCQYGLTSLGDAVIKTLK